MKVLAVVPSACGTSPGQRFRIEQWAPHLERRGFQFTFAPFEGDAFQRILYQNGRIATKALHVIRASIRRLGVLAEAGDHDVIFLHREAAVIGPAVIERMLGRTRIPIVYDFDDPIWLPYRSPTNHWFSRLKFPGKTAAICRLASAVIVGNRLLAGYAAQHSGSVHVVPSTIDLEQYPAQSGARAATERITLGWTGSHSTLPFLDGITDVLKRLARERTYRLLVVSHTDAYARPELAAEVVARRWRAETEADDVREMDIGLAPFPSSGWTPWRCHGKVLQYMAAGLPAIVSPVGIVPDYITHGVNGLLASTPDEWHDGLVRLLDDAELRERLGQAARQTIEQQYSAEAWSGEVGTILERAAGTRRRAA